MARTESKTFQCHPDDAQREIDFHQKFHWSLLSSQDVKTVDNSLEKRGDAIYSVRKSEHYVKLTFSRELDAPNLKEVKALEEAYHALSEPVCTKPAKPGQWVVGCWLGLLLIISFVATAVVDVSRFVGLGFDVFFTLGLGGMVFVIGFVLLIVHYVSVISPKVAVWKKECARIDQEHERNMQKYTQERRRILSEVAKYN